MIKLRFRATVLTLVCALLTVAPRAWARDALTLVPQGALGFVVVNDLTAASEKIQRLATQMKAPAPPMLMALKMQSGIQVGLDEKGDALMALMPGENGLKDPKPILALPTSDYGKLIAQIGGDASKQITEVTVADKDLLAAKLDNYVVFVDSDSRSLLTSLLGADGKLADDVKPVAQWAAEKDFALAILPEGLRLATAEGIKGLEQAQDEFPDELAGQSVAAAFDMYIQMLKMIRDEIQVAAAGFQMDADGNVSLLGHLDAKPDGKLAGVIGAAPYVDEQPLANIPSGNYVAAGSMAWSDKFAKAYMRFSMNMMKASGSMYGLEKVKDKDLENYMQAAGDLIGNMRGLSVHMNQGEIGDPIYSNIFYSMRVGNSAQFMTSIEKTITMWNDMVDAAQDDAPLKYEVEKTKIADKSGLMLTMDVMKLMAAQAKGDPNVQAMMQQMSAMMFGSSGKLNAFMFPINDNTVLAGIGTAKQMAQTAKDIEGGKLLRDDAAVAKTTALLHKDSCMVGYVNPRGVVNWVTRIISQVSPFGAPGEIPPFPETPPVGFGARVSGSSIDTQLVVPGETLDGLSKYIETVQNQLP